jgi:hypothetical protein
LKATKIAGTKWILRGKMMLWGGAIKGRDWKDPTSWHYLIEAAQLQMMRDKVFKLILTGLVIVLILPSLIVGAVLSLMVAALMGVPLVAPRSPAIRGTLHVRAPEPRGNRTPPRPLEILAP